MNHRTAIMIACIGLGASLTGCTQNSADIEAEPVYPEARQGETLDLHVIRDGTVIQFTNSTARAIPPCRLWLNHWYSRPLGGLAIGQTVEIPLDEFKSRFGEGFRAGGFFATERAERVVLAQLEIDGQIKGLVVVSTPYE